MRVPGGAPSCRAREWDKKRYKILGRQKVADNWSLVTGDFLHEPLPQWRVSWGNYQTLIKNCKLCIEWTNGDTMKENVHKTVIDRLNRRRNATALPYQNIRDTEETEALSS